jgi:hypothetical protein
MLAALSFVPSNDAIAKYEELCQFDFFTTNEVLLEPLLGYFEYTWIGALRANGAGRRQPLFSHGNYDFTLTT